MMEVLAQLEPGDRELQEALEFGDHLVLRSTAWGADSIMPVSKVLRMYGEPGSDAVLAAMRACNHYVLIATARCFPDSIKHVLDAYGAPGSPALVEGLSAFNHRTLLYMQSHIRHAVYDGYGYVLSMYRPLHLVLHAYGAPGCDAVVAGLRANKHKALVYACRNHDLDDMRMVIAAYGPPGCPAVLEALSVNNHEPLIQACKSPDAQPIRIVTQAYGMVLPPTEILKKVYSSYGTGIFRESLHLACMAARDPAFWQFDEGRWKLTLAAFTDRARWALMKPIFMLLYRVPGEVASALHAYFYNRPWLLFTAGRLYEAGEEGRDFVFHPFIDG